MTTTSSPSAQMQTSTIHFAHGVNLAASRDGQSAAALADVLLRGLSQTRFRRLASVLSRYPGLFEALPEGWMRVLPSEAPLTNLNAWTNLINGLSSEDWPNQNDQGKHLLELIEILDQGKDQAAEIGDALLKGLPLSIWRRALLLGPPASLELSLETLRTDDSLDPKQLDHLDTCKLACRSSTTLCLSARTQLGSLAARGL